MNSTGLQQPTDSYLDFIIRYYKDTRYLPYYIDLSGVHYDDFVTGITMERPLYDITLPKDPYFVVPSEREQEDIRVSKYREQTLLDITLQTYGDVSRILDNMTDSKISDYALYRDVQFYKKQSTDKNKYSEYYKQNNIRIATGTQMIEILPQGEVLDIYGDFADDYNNDFKI